MSRDRLDMGFVTWQGQRVFVPSWFGAPRIVLTAEDEVRILKLKYRMYAMLAASIVVLGVTSVWFSLDSSMDMLVPAAVGLQSIILLILAVLVVRERRYFARWPVYALTRFSRSGFMLRYFRSLPARSRLYELCWGLFGLWIFSPMLINAGQAPLASSADTWSPARLAFAGLVLAALGLPTFFAARYALLAALAFVPPSRAQAHPTT